MNRTWLLAVGLALCASPVAGQQIVREVPNRPLTVQLDSVPTASLVTMLLRDVMKVPYVIAPDVLADRRPTSVKLVIPRDRIPERVVAYLRRSGFSVELQGGTVYVSRAGRSAPAGAPVAPGVPFGSPLDPTPGPAIAAANPPPAGLVGPRLDLGSQDPGTQDLPAAVEAIVAYVPAHRDVDYLVTVIEPLLPGVTFGARGSDQANQAKIAVASRLGPDLLVMAGQAVDLGKAKRLIEMLDRPRPVVAVKAVVLQVSDIKARGSALSILASFGGGNLELGSYPGEPPASQFIRLSVGGLRAVLSAVREDSRFKVVATPNLAALSGTVATMNAGSQVPTVGAVSIAEGGTPVQSIVYRDSGISLTVLPVVRGDLIELSVQEERSTFVRTTTGVEDSPTLQKSSASASVVMRSGESIILAGLNEDSQGATRQGIFGGLLGVRSRDQSSSELMVVLQAELVPSPDAPAGVFVPIFDPEEPADRQEASDREAV